MYSMYLDLVPRSAELSDEESEGRGGGGAVAYWKIEQYRNNRADCSHPETSETTYSI